MTEDLIELRSKIEVKGRGTGDIIKSRFDEIQIQYIKEDARQIKTQVFKDYTKNIIAYNDSPDVGLNATVNPYRGCEHGCIYCYARPTHEYFGLSLGLDFESKLFAKMDAAILLKKELMAKKWQPQVLGLSGVTDCYQPIEKELRLTEACLRVLLEFKNPVVIITKNYLVTRDIEILKELSRYNAAHVVISLTTLEKEVARIMEPRASSPKRRLLAIEELRKQGIPVSINMAPIVPGLTDHEIPALLKAAKDAGAINANYVMLRLPYGVKDIFEHWVSDNFPDRKNKIINRIKEIRNGQLYSSEFGNRMTGSGIFAEQIGNLFNQYKKLYKLNESSRLTTEHFKRPDANGQLSLF